jgi:hypothetical protein
MDGYGFQAQVNRIAPIGLLPEGLRIDVGFAGTLTEGPLTGAAIEGIDYLLIRHDGVAVIDARELVTGADGTTISLRVDGYIVPPFEMPELSALLDPSFSWPDVDLPLHGAARPQSAAPALQAVNRTVYAFTGTVNMARGSLVVNARRINAEASQHDAGLVASH